MRKVLLWMMAGMMIWSTRTWAHLCNNIYRTPDRVVVKPEKPVATVDRSDEFRVFVQNNYPTYLHNIRLSAKVEGSGVAASITPESVAELRAGERTAFTVRITVPESASKGQYPLTFSISADEIGFRPVEEASQAALRQAAQGDNPSYTVLAAESLARRKDPLGGQVLTNMVRQGEREYRGRAIRALGKCGDRTHISFLKSLLTDQDGFIRGNTLLALGCLKDEAATFRGRAQDRDEFVRTCAVAGLCLAGHKSPDVLDRLRKSLSSSNVFVRIACGWALAAQRDQAGVAALDQAFQTDDMTQRVMAGDALVDVANRPDREEGQEQTPGPQPPASPPSSDSSAGALGTGKDGNKVPSAPGSLEQKPDPGPLRVWSLGLISFLVLAGGVFWWRYHRPSAHSRTGPGQPSPPSSGPSTGRYRRTGR